SARIRRDRELHGGRTGLCLHAKSTDEHHGGKVTEIDEDRYGRDDFDTLHHPGSPQEGAGDPARKRRLGHAAGGATFGSGGGVSTREQWHGIGFAADD